MQTFAFTKLFKPAPAAEAFKMIKDLGFDGLDLTVRAGGYVDPESDHWEQDWAEAQGAWEAAGIPPGMFSTNILDPSSTRAKQIIAAAEKHNVKYIKLGYAKLRFGHLREELTAWRKGILDLVPIAEHHGVTIMMHVHSANFSAAVPFHWLPTFEQTDSEAIRMYLDPCHMHTEGNLQGWLMALEMAKDVTAVVAVKDYRWYDPYKKPEQGYFYPIFTRLAKGLTPWNQVVHAMKVLGIEGPFSIHGEYTDVDRHDIPAGIKKDLDYFKALWEAPLGELNLNKEKIFMTED